jgi:hypothetical protein
MLSRFSKYEELNPGGLGQAQILIHSDLTKQYEVNVDVNGVNDTVIDAGLSSDATVKLCVVEGIHIPGTDTIYARPEYINPREEGQRHLALPDANDQEPYLSIMSNLIRNAVRLGDVRSNRGRFIIEQGVYRPAIFLGSVAIGILDQGGTDPDTGKFIGEDRKHKLERRLFLAHRNDIQIVEK